MLIITDLHVVFDNNIVLENLSISFKEGKIHGIVGLNGSGKTTLLNTVYGFIKPEKGKMLLLGKSVDPDLIAYLETNNYFYSRITGIEYLELFRLSNPKFDIEGWNHLFELPLKDLIETYSTGMKKKLALLGILSLDRPLLLLDEPFNGLDLESNRNIRFILTKLKENGKTIIITSHIMETLTSNCDSISFLNDKCIELSLDRSEFDELEEKFFRLHDDKNRKLINELLGKSFPDGQ